MPRRVSKDSNTKVTIKIPRNLYNRLQEIIKGSGFDSVTDFTVFVLRDLAAMGSTKHIDSTKKQDTGSLTEEEIQAVRKRLQTLGYF